MSLHDVIQDFLQERRAQMSDTEFAELNAAILRMAESAVAAQALHAGDTAAGFSLTNTAGAHVSLEGLLRTGPVVLSFYRGGWCPFCNMELDALQHLLPEITLRGASLVAISPEAPDRARETAERRHLPFDVLSDSGNAVAKRYGLAFELDEFAREFSTGQGVDLTAVNADGRWELPLPGTYVIDRAGKIAWSFVDGDFTQRAEPTDVLAALDRLALTKTASDLEEG